MNKIHSKIPKTAVSLLVVIGLVLGLGSIGIPGFPKIPCLVNCTTITSSDVLSEVGAEPVEVRVGAGELPGGGDPREGHGEVHPVLGQPS